MLSALVLFGALAAGPVRAETTCDPQTFEDELAVLKQPEGRFHVDAVYPDYRPPRADPNVRIDPTLLEYWRQAFEIAPSFFQKRLCRLTTIFLDPDSCHGTCTPSPWSYREHPSQFAPNAQPPHYGRYIALPASEPPTYQRYETRLVQMLLKGWNGPRYTADPDNVAVTILAALAHEDGHIAFHDIYSPEPGEPADLSRFCGGNYFVGSWKAPTDTAPTGFTGVSGRHLDDDVQIADLLNTLKEAPDFRRTGEMLNWLHAEERWAGLLAAFTAEHDFVETYKLFVLTHAKTPLQSLKITIPLRDKEAEHEVLHALGRASELNRKYSCFTDLFGR